MDVLGSLFGFIFQLLTILSTKFSELYGEVECTIGSKPAIFGQPLSILCRNTNPLICIKNESRVWMGGENLDLLVLEGIPKSKVGRYSEKVQSCSDFELLISNLSESDLNHSYCCTVGFSECRLKLSLAENDFEYHPEEHDIHKNFSISVHDLFVSVNISRVYPVPKCSVLFGVQKLDEYINQSASRVGNFFSTYFDFEFKLAEEQCPVKINITCLVGSTLIPILTSEMTNCSENRDLIAFIRHSLTVPIFCSFLTCMYFVLLTWSLCRNRKKIYTTCYALSERSLLQWRRPILAVILTLGSIYLAGHTEYISFKQFLQDSEDVENDTAKPIGFCVSSMLLTQVSLCFISNPDTISIREGFRNSTKRFVKKVKRKKKNSGNPAEQMRLNRPDTSVADQSTDGCHQFAKDASGNQS
ncbi:uncharacterized protein LOC127712623 [Mytilus californianus]|uniref:uncharacterized protein LOC127712623 n=1 Tax=Mytilus californianus TaxID=6549 RepID=UPI0022481F1A|nr:uncharacterized protein LOC127712623 [Mytilus californianus]